MTDYFIAVNHRSETLDTAPDYDSFDYLEGRLTDWIEQFDFPTEPRNLGKLIDDEFLPRFEAALHRNNVKALSGKVV